MPEHNHLAPLNSQDRAWMPEVTTPQHDLCADGDGGSQAVIAAPSWIVKGHTAAAKGQTVK
jgi:hypothetical protein